MTFAFHLLLGITACLWIVILWARWYQGAVGGINRVSERFKNTAGLVVLAAIPFTFATIIAGALTL